MAEGQVRVWWNSVSKIRKPLHYSGAVGGSCPGAVAPALAGRPLGKWPEPPCATEVNPLPGGLGEQTLEGGSPHGAPDWRALERCL